MKNITYKTKFLFSYIIVIILIIIPLIYTFNSFVNSDVTHISKQEFKNKILEREEYLDDFFYPYKTSIQALALNDDLHNYLNSQDNQSTIENLFLQLKRSLPCVSQVRLLDLNGNEIIRADGTPIGIMKDKAISKLVDKEHLKNKSNRDYFKRFLDLNENELGLSHMDLNAENGKIDIPKAPTLRMGMLIFDENKQKQAMIIYNICLRSFFNLLNKTTLYHVHLIDKYGNFILHHNPKYGLMGDEPYTLKDEFPNEHMHILENDEYYGTNFYSKKLTHFDNGQELRILLEIKYLYLTNENISNQDRFIYVFIVIALLCLPLVIYFSKIPDKIKQEAKQQKFISQICNLPNRMALMQDLLDKKFEDSMIILIEFTNIIKIQNSYGYSISDTLVREIAQYLSNYKDSYIQKLYKNNYHVFAFQYRYVNDTTLEKFLNKLHSNLEKQIFTIKFEDLDIDFSINCLIGTSNPNNLNNSIDELQEAENALDNAIEQNKNIVIYDNEHVAQIVENIQNIAMSKNIKNAIDNDLLILHYQPIYNNHTNKIEKYECLVRMQIGDVLYFPDNFLPLAKEINYYEKLTYKVIDKACDFFKDKEYEFSINLSIYDVSNKLFKAYLFDKLEQYKVKDKIVLEIVESESINNYEEFIKFIKEAKEFGCKIAIDDFGSGYSNFDYILEFSEYIDYLKIDGSLIKNIALNENTAILVGSLKFLCDNLNIKSIAEYVENEEILATLSSIGIDYSQGYHIGKPKDSLLEG